MASVYLVGLLALVLTVTSANAQCSKSNQMVYADCANEIQRTSVCQYENILDLLEVCSGECSQNFRENTYWLNQLANELSKARETCNGRVPRACGLLEGLDCALAVVAFATNAGQLATVNPNDGQAVCEYVNDYSKGIDKCQALIVDCTTSGQDADDAKAIVSYILVATGQSCVCISEASKLVSEFNADTTSKKGSAKCNQFQSDLSALLTNTNECTDALPQTPIAGLNIFNIDFFAAASSMIRIGASGTVSRCELRFVAKAPLSASISIALLLASLLVHTLRP